MRKILTLLCAFLLAVQNVSAQHDMYVVSKSGELTGYSVQKVLLHDDIFTFTYDEPSDISMKRFTVSFGVQYRDTTVKSLSETPEIGICISSYNDSPTIYDGKVRLGISITSYKRELSGLEKGTTYYYRAYVMFLDKVYYGDVRQITTLGIKSEDENCKFINGHKFVDLGLPSGLFWAETNIGALSATDDGDYFAWGENVPKQDYSMDTYKHCLSSDKITITKYNRTDCKAVLDKEDDAACANWGDSCRMPTKEDFVELCDTSNCTWTWTSKANSVGSTINGYEVTSKMNGNSIFLPASGYRNGDYLDYHGSHGNYWSSTVYGVSNAYGLRFYSSYRNANTNYRYYGFPVRPVAEP